MRDEGERDKENRDKVKSETRQIKTAKEQVRENALGVIVTFVT